MTKITVYDDTANELEKLATKVEKNETVPKWFSYASTLSFSFFVVIYFSFSQLI